MQKLDETEGAGAIWGAAALGSASIAFTLPSMKSLPAVRTVRVEHDPVSRARQRKAKAHFRHRAETGILLPAQPLHELGQLGTGTGYALSTRMDTIKIKVGTLTLTEARNEDLPQEFAAWHQTVRIEPGTYDVFAYLDWSDGGYQIRSLSAECEGVTISSNFRSHMVGQWGTSDKNCNGQRATAYIRFCTFGQVGEPTRLLEQVTLCDAIVRTEWDPQEHIPTSTTGGMWRLTWNRDRKPIIVERSRYSGGLSLAAFEDDRRFKVDGVEMSPAAASALCLHLLHMHDVDQLTVGETVSGWSYQEKRSLQVTRLA